MANFNSTDFIYDYQELLDLVKKLTNKWDPSTSTEADPGVVLLKLAALMKDKISYKQDMSEAQAYLDTVSDRQSAFELLQMLGYILKNKQSTVGAVSLSLSDSYTDAAGVTLKSFETTFSDIDSSKTYFLLKDTILNKGKTNLVNVMEGSPFYIEKEGIDLYNIKDIDESRRLYLGKSGLAQNGVFIGIVDNTGKEDYSRWSNLDASVLYPTGQYFFVLTSSTGENYIQFPQNVSELMGSNNFKIRATYSLGASGNIKAGTLVKIDLSDKNISSAIRVFQRTDFTSGQDAETISQGVQNYYNSQEVFNTLVTSHDFQAAVRKVLADVNSGITSYAFSNAFTRTAIDRQLQVVSKYNAESFDYYKVDSVVTEPDTAESYRTVDVGCLKNSDVYDESFVYLDDTKDNDSTSVSISANIESQLRNSATIGTSFKLDTSGYIKNVAIPTGIVFVNATTSEEQNEILQNIITTLKSKYSAKNLTFGKEIDYSDLVQNIFNSDSRILNVNLNTLEYVPNVVTSAETNILSDDEKTSIMAEAVINGQVPLYKFLNRRNTSDISVLNPGYINQGLGMTKYKKLDSRPLTIDTLDNGFNWLKQEGKTMRPFNSLNVLQLRRPLYVDDIVYGYGAEVSYGTALTDTKILSKTTLLQGSVIAKGSVLTLDPTASKGIVAKYSSDFEKIIEDGVEICYYCASLPEDYTVTQYLEFLINQKTIEKAPMLKSGTVLVSGSYLNSEVYSPKTLTISGEYVLKENEFLNVVVKGSATRYGSGTRVKVTRGSLVSNTSTILGSSMTVSVLKESKSIIDANMNYFVVSNDPEGFKFNNGEYMLEENEFFVYSNETLSEYLILGAGTLLKCGDKADLELKNVKTSEERNNVKESSFKKLEYRLTAIDMELSTFSEGYTINNISSSIGNTFEKIKEDIEVYEVVNGEVKSDAYLTFKKDQEYWARMCVMLRPNIDGVLNFTAFGSENVGETTGVQLELLHGKEKIGKIKSNATESDEWDCLLFSNIKQFFIYGGKITLDLISEKLEMALCVYRQQNKTQDFIEANSISPRGMNIKLNEGTTTVTFDVDKLSPGQGVAALFRILLPAGVYVTINNDSPDTAYASLTTLKKYSGRLVTAIYKFQETNSPTLTLTFSNGHAGQIASISDYSIITDYSDEIKSNSFSANLLEGSQANDQPLLNGVVEKKILNLLLGDSKAYAYFDVLATPKGDYSDPSDANNFFNSLHPRNYKTLPYLELDSEKLSSKLRIIPIKGRMTR
jgi:hypothetical protein